jgi:hypothetical protein
MLGYLEVVEINTFNITSTHKFEEGDDIYDIISIDDTSRYFLATIYGLLKTSKDQLIKHYYIGKTVESLCHITGSIYLVGFEDDGVIVWDEEKD